MMNQLCMLITPLAKNIPAIPNCDYVGVDAGVFRILESEYLVSWATGDFDSMTEEEFHKIDSICPIEKYPIHKDETDSELAIELAYKKGYKKIILYGACSGRLDHTIANLRLLMYRYPYLILMDDKQKVQQLSEGIHVIENVYPHVSFFPIIESVISLYDFEYPLRHQLLKMDDIFTVSNSLMDKKGEIHVEKGRILCVQSSYR